MESSGPLTVGMAGFVGVAAGLTLTGDVGNLSDPCNALESTSTAADRVATTSRNSQISSSCKTDAKRTAGDAVDHVADLVGLQVPDHRPRCSELTEQIGKLTSTRDEVRAELTTLRSRLDDTLTSTSAETVSAS